MLGGEDVTQRKGDSMKNHMRLSALLLSFLALGAVTVVFGSEGLTSEETGGRVRTHAALLYEINPQVDGLLTSAPHKNHATSVRVDNGRESSSLFQNGRALFTITTMAKTGYVVPSIFGTAFDQLDKRMLTGLSLMSVGGSFFLSYAATQGYPLGYGKAIMMNHGGTLGYLIPSQVATLLHYGTSIDDKYRVGERNGGEYEGDLASEKLRAWSTLFLYPYGMYLGWYAGFIGNNDAGNALVTTYLSQTWGALGYAIPYYWYDPDNPNEEKDYWMTASGLSMGLALTGMWAGAKLSEQNTYSAGRGALLYIAGALGAATGYVAPTFASPEDHLTTQEIERLHLSTTIAGYAVGSVIGMAINPSRDYSFWEASIIGGAAAGGALVGMGVPYLMKKDDRNAYKAGILAGAWLGFFAGEHISRGLGSKTTAYSRYEKKMKNIDVALPGILTVPMLAMNGGKDESSSSPAPLVNVDIRF